jgi:hypothetical protein
LISVDPTRKWPLDVGDPALAGSVVYDADLQTYTVSGAGRNMWFDQDEFHFVWKRLSGDFILPAHAEFLGQGVDAHRKLGWMARSSQLNDLALGDEVDVGLFVCSHNPEVIEKGVFKNVRITVPAAENLVPYHSGRTAKFAVTNLIQAFCLGDIRKAPLPVPANPPTTTDDTFLAGMSHRRR